MVHATAPDPKVDCSSHVVKCVPDAHAPAGEWGNICDDGWDMRNAEVACHQLGFGDADEARIDYFNEYSYDYVRGQAQPAIPIWMDNVHCSGSETRLSECAFRGWSLENCGHYEDVAIRCKGYDLEKTVSFSITFFCVSTTLSILSLGLATAVLLRVLQLQRGGAVLTPFHSDVELSTVVPSPVHQVHEVRTAIPAPMDPDVLQGTFSLKPSGTAYSSSQHHPLAYSPML